MSSGEQQLQADFALVRKLLQEYPSIKLVATKGEPPEQYDIEYNLKGFKASPDGTILPANKHQVRITLPFGYPHFPPTAKPLSSIFHPDIDPDAIRIADFWKESRTLPELIIHIGQMICGTFYSADPFNQRAFDWFEERKSWLPFDILEPHEGDEEEAFIPRREQTSAGAATAAQTPVPTIAGTEPAPREEEIPLDFTVQGEPVQETGEESVELDDLLDGEFSHAFDLDEPGDEPPGSGGETLEDLTALPEDETIAADIGFEAPAAEPAAELTGPRDEAPSLDFGLELELDDLTAELQTVDLTGGAAGDLSAAFDLTEETVAPQEETIVLGELVGLEAEDLGGERGLAKGPAAPDPPLPDNFAVDFAIEGATQVPDEELVGQETAADEGLLGGISLQLDDEHGKKFGGQDESIRPLIERKEIFTAKKVLASLPDPSSVPDRDELERTIAAAISEAEEIYKKADKLEQNGELEKAGLMLDLVANIAIDYPGLDFARNRIRESMMAGGQQKPTAEEEKKSINAPAVAPGAEKPAPHTMTVPKLSVRVPYKLLGVLLALGGIAGGGTVLYLQDSASLAKARTEFDKGRQLAGNLDFKGAEKAFNDARTKLGSILLFTRGGKKELSQAIDTIVSEQSFKEGLRGKVLYNEQYVPIEAAKAIDSFTQHADSAEQARNDGNIDQAIISYEKSLEYVEQAGFQDKAEDIRQKISALRLQQAMTMARKAEEDKEWKKAAESYQMALELSSTQAKPEEEHADIVKLQAAASLRHELEEGKRAFTSSEWQKAAERLQRVQDLITDSPTLLAESEQQEIGRLLINAGVYQLLANAKNAFAQNDWDGAIKEYNNAVALLREKGGILGQAEVADSIGKIEKTALMTKITREQCQIVGGATDGGNLSTNLEHSRAIVSLIEKSPLKNDPALQEIYRDTKGQIGILEKEILVSGKVAYLKERYETIFRENYPSTKSSELLNPQVTFVKREGNVLIFSMSCAERNQGRVFRLELNYQYDLDKGTWSLYSGKL